jgi:hypothetical protein
MQRGESDGLSRRGQPATFSRFVLPMPYWLTPEKSVTAKPAHYFEEAGPEDWLHSATSGKFDTKHNDFAAAFEAALDQERRDYFTRETGAALFRRARWFMLRGLGDTVFKLPVRREDEWTRVTVHLRPPALVLFEFPKTPKEGGPGDGLPQAMLVLEAWWEPGNGDTAPRLEDLLVFNELFRYFQCPYERHARLPAEDGNPDHNYRRELADLPVDWRQPGRKLANVAAGEDPRLACYLRRWEWMLECPIRLPGAQGPDSTGSRKPEWWSLVPKQWITNAQHWVLGQSAEKALADPDGEEEYPAHGWLLYADNRAYVWTCAVVEDNAPVLGRVKELGTDSTRPIDTQLGHWLRLLNVDPLAPDPERCTAFEARFADERTYRRWAHFGALQGFNYHAGAMLTGPCDEPPTWRHFGAMYFDQALLLLYVRVTLFRFSYALSRLSDAARARAEDPDTRAKLKRRFEQIRLDFALFTNLYQFPLLSNQQQGIELYTLCRERMDVQALFEEVKSEVEATHEFLSLDVQDKMAVLGGQLTVVATVGLLLALVFSAPGLSDLVNRVFCLEKWPGWSLPASVILLAVVLWVALAFCQRASTRVAQAFEWPARFLEGWLPDRSKRRHARLAALKQRKPDPPRTPPHDKTT